MDTSSSHTDETLFQDVQVAVEHQRKEAARQKAKGRGKGAAILRVAGEEAMVRAELSTFLAPEEPEDEVVAPNIDHRHQEGKLLDAASYRKLVAIEADEEHPERAEDIIGMLAPVSPANYEMSRIEAGVNHDITVLNSLLLLLKTVREEAIESNGDDKVCQVLAGPLRGQKVLMIPLSISISNYAMILRGSSKQDSQCSV